MFRFKLNSENLQDETQKRINRLTKIVITTTIKAPRELIRRRRRKAAVQLQGPQVRLQAAYSVP